MTATIAISIVSVGIAMIVAAFQISRATKQDRHSADVETTTIIVKLEGIADGVKDIKNDMKELKTEVEGIKERVILVEASTKSAHKRIDTLEEVHG